MKPPAQQTPPPQGTRSPQQKAGANPSKKIKVFKALSYAFAFLIMPVFGMLSLATGKKRRGLKHHFGWVPEVKKQPGQKLVWVHALSLGEVNGAAPVLKILRDKRPNIMIVVSVTMDTINHVQSHLLAHQYEGLIERSQLRGRRRGRKGPANR